MLTLSVALPNGHLSINAQPWADVVIDGTAAGQTPLANLTLPIGSHEIVFRHPQFPEQRQTAIVKADGVTRVSANMQR
jgi:serine/threonine-protein kinase